MHHLQFLWNGGLDPATANPDELRERRTVSTTIFMLTPVGLLVIFINTLRDLSGDNPTIAAGLLFAITALWVQAKLNSPKIAANMAVVGFWAILVLIMSTSGILGQTWIWLFALPGIATLLADIRSGAFWSIVCAATVWVFTSLQLADKLTLDAQVQVLDDGYVIGLATEGSIVLMVLCASVLIFRYSQNKAEKKLTNTVLTLQNEIHSRKLAEKNAIASERSKDAFLATMSHELRTPMNGVLGSIRLIQQSDSEEEKAEYTNVAMESGESLLELINNIMDLSSLESGIVVLEKIPINLRSLTEKIISPFNVQASNKGLNLHIEIDDAVPNYILGDPTRVRQILINLVGNAIKFTEKGEIRVGLQCQEKQLLLRVSDTGIGIPKRAQAALFEPYVQADISTNRRFGGYGLGLSIVKKLIVQMGGTIEINSTLGKGSEFSLWLPFEACDPENKPAATHASKDITPLKILVADDNAVNRMVLSRLLEKDNHFVVPVTNGQEALDYVRNQDVDVVLMDIQMPELDGISATKEIRKLENANANLPIIAITANTSSKEVQKMMSAGMNDYFSKPFRYEDIQEILRAR